MRSAWLLARFISSIGQCECKEASTVYFRSGGDRQSSPRLLGSAHMAGWLMNSSGAETPPRAEVQCSPAEWFLLGGRQTSDFDTAGLSLSCRNLGPGVGAMTTNAPGLFFRWNCRHKREATGNSV
ncbi:hypothetical protein Sphch_3146 [Sphingobium chlorophenolicum L-1]|uniref:Uncharacterized protein n=1 Tax=Sphingobium chlorophenolicum L-1 TaxID=690566 RepID=F6F2U9_SPHCR|nr:hypothetical protein Sphch_3146 [Sphingobium chlorophenolicum L-1]